MTSLFPFREAMLPIRLPVYDITFPALFDDVIRPVPHEVSGGSKGKTAQALMRSPVMNPTWLPGWRLAKVVLEAL